jgi:Integrase core domain
MNRTLKAQTPKPAAATVTEQQRRFDHFRRHYNEERPHEALEQTPLAAHWRPPAHALPARLEVPWYDADHEVRRVRWDGAIKWRGDEVFVGEALAGELISLAEHENGHVARFCHRDLGVIGGDRRFLRYAPPRARLRVVPETAVRPPNGEAIMSGISPVQRVGTQPGRTARCVALIDLAPPTRRQS